jgi:RHS repeat-associated protein
VAYGGSDTPLAQSATGTVSDYEQNLHGDLSLTVTTAGTASGTHTYDPYGKTITTTGTAATAGFGYQSDPTDPTTTLVDMGTRLYDPNQGRFTTRDSEFGGWDDPNTINQYTYAADSPLQYTDPNGMRICIDDACHYGVDPAHMTKAQQRTIWTQYNNSPSQKPSPPPTVIIQIYRHGTINPGKHNGSNSPQCLARVYAAGCSMGGGGPDFGFIRDAAGAANHASGTVNGLMYYAPLETASFLSYATYDAGYSLNRTLESESKTTQILTSPLRPVGWTLQAGGLAGDVGIDVMKNALLNNHESVFDEHIPGYILGSRVGPFAQQHGLQNRVFLHGLYLDNGSPRLDFAP